MRANTERRIHFNFLRIMKKRPISHLVDAAGVDSLKAVLPKEWVLREYRPDYGIDFDLEVFDYTASGDLASLGEHFFVQLKSSSNVRSIKRTVFPRFNVEKGTLKIDSSTSKTISVIPVQMDVSDLQLARSMGPAVPTLLIICDVKEGRLHFVCLNDFVDKILIPSDAAFDSKSSHTVDVPTWNLLSSSAADLLPLRFFARRAKLYAAFNRFRYQAREVQSLACPFEIFPLEKFRNSEALSTIMHFLRVVKTYDFWETTWAWPAVALTWRHVQRLEADLHRFRLGESLGSIFDSRFEPPLRQPGTLDSEFEDYIDTVHGDILMHSINNTWGTLEALGNQFEEICREWSLPTYLGALAEETAVK